MSVTYEVLPQHEVVLVTFTGDVDVDENIEALLAYADDPLFAPTHHVLMNLADCRFPDANFADLQRMTYRLMPFYQKRSPLSRSSIFAPGDVAYGIARMYKVLAEGRSHNEIGIFRDKEEVLAFLDMSAQEPAGDYLKGRLTAEASEVPSAHSAH